MDIMRTDSATEQTYDAVKLAELSKLAIGGRTLKEFAIQSGLSEGFLSRLTTGKLKSAPTKRSLAKLTADTSRPQNGIKLGDVMSAAGYEYTAPESQEQRWLAPGDGDAVPAEVLTAAFPAYLTASVLEMSGQLGSYSSRNQREMFILQAKGQKDVIGIPAFCEKAAVWDEIRETKWNLMMAMSIYGAGSKDVVFVILTNQPELYKSFDEGRMVGTGGEFYIALTEDFRTFTRQRPVMTTDIDGKPDEINQAGATYDLTRVARP